MKAPQFGHSKAKKRGRQGNGKILHGRALPSVARPDSRLPYFHALGLRGGNVLPPDHRVRYIEPATAQYEDGTHGAPVSLHLNHKSANWVNGIKVSGEGPIVTKRYTVVKNSRQVSGNTRQGQS